MSNWKLLGEFIEQCDERNGDGTYGEDSVRGIATSKELIATKANLDGVSLTSYKLVKPGEFAYVPDTSRRGDKISLGRNEEERTVLVSSISCVFRIKDHDQLDPGYLSILFRRAEFDRYARFNSWGSAREAFSYADMARVRIPVPDIKVQRSLVATWQGLREMQAQNERLAATLMPLCRSYLQDLKHKYKAVEIGPYLEPCDERNVNNELGEGDVRGVTSAGVFDNTKASTEGIDFSKYKVVHKGDFAYNPSRINLGSIAYNDNADAIVSPMYIVFRVKKEKQQLLISEFLRLWFTRPDFLRSTTFFATGSVRDLFCYKEMCNTRVPIPSPEVQRAIVEVFQAAQSARRTAERAAALSKEICPALIQRAIHS